MALRMVAESEAGAHAGIYGEIRSCLGLGIVPNVFKAMAAVGHDVLAQNWTAFRQTVLEGCLPRTVKEMVALVVSREHGCEYGVYLYSYSLFHLGISRPVVESLAELGDCPEFPPDFRRLLAFAREYSVDPDGVDPDFLEMAGFSEDDALQVVDTVLIASGMARFAAECELPVDL
ncbi:MAG TPA: carboxymuconolactone decarboxylase family protein [Symbiobacteriaceae bacterium]|nr:carboxymuconolactone decarboxylase family protein [Symbiobacteriaceae bacterium]